MNLKVIPNDQFFTMVENEIRAGGSLELRIKGSSMHPTLKNGKHRVVLAPFRKERLHIGMIALFTYGGKHVLHRLVAMEGSLLIFQGDNLPYKKECVTEGDIIAFAESIISPKGKVIDCKKRSFRARSRIFVFTNTFMAIPLRKVKGVFAKFLRASRRRRSAQKGAAGKGDRT